MSFEEYLNTNYNEKLDDLTKFLINDAFKAGAQSRQAEIDELKKRIEVLSIYIGSDDFIDIRADYHFQFKKLIEILEGKEND